MGNLIPVEYKNQRIMTTKVLAEQFGTEDKIISQNFNRNHMRFIEGKHYFCLEGEELKTFKGYLQNEESLKFVSILYLWTDRGAARHAKILDTDEAWDIYEKLEENYFNHNNVSKQLSPMDQLKLQYQVLEQHEEKLSEVENKVEKLENNMTIDYSQQLELNELAKKKVIAILGGKDAPAYKELNKKTFSQIWKDYKRIVQVNSYRNTSIKDLGFGRRVIIDWKPSRELELMIKGCNSQLRM
ncbi:ORF6C domain-containing protein [Clostridium sp. ZBS17]|uniref:ORF6C domain-containing protein n=1 Tax=Clostridium sp. ZBS17 TaxID=2949968 RepID=UPI0020797ADC|nr:ORF6C domain-containing protein [Clostridium sp. ZBS17]